MSLIEPFYFGHSSKIFGVYHASQSAPRRHAVVIAGPLLNESMRAHYALRQIAINLANAGFDVLRFDYEGMGNSHGSLLDIVPEDWTNNISDAVKEISDICGAKSVSIVAVRFAACLTGHVSDKFNIDNLIFWDPILTGEVWYELLRKSQSGLREKSSAADVIGETEYMGHVLSRTFLEEVRSTGDPIIMAKTTLAVLTEGYGDHFDSVSNGVRRKDISYNCGWEDPSSRILYPHDVIRIICDEMI